MRRLGLLRAGVVLTAMAVGVAASVAPAIAKGGHRGSGGNELDAPDRQDRGQGRPDAPAQRGGGQGSQQGGGEGGQQGDRGDHDWSFGIPSPTPPTVPSPTPPTVPPAPTPPTVPSPPTPPALGAVVAQIQVDARGARSLVDLAPGLYQVTASGTYTYDTRTPGIHQADAFCSTGDFAYWNGTVDGAGRASGLEPGTVSEWQPLRYDYGTAPPGLLGTGIGVAPFTPFQPFDRVLELSIDGIEPAWIGRPGPHDSSGAITTCDTATHTYTTPLPWPGGQVYFQIDDVNYEDNSGSLGVTINRIAP